MTLFFSSVIVLRGHFRSLLSGKLLERGPSKFLVLWLYECGLSGVHADQVNIERQILGSPVIICKSDL